MGILTDKFKNHPVHQAIETTLKYIDDCKNNKNLTDANRDSLDAYGQLLTYAKYVMENNITQVVPPQILTNLTNNINNLQNNNALNIETTYNLYTTITSDLAKIPVYSDKNIAKAGLGRIIEKFDNDKEKIQTAISNEMENFKQKQNDELEKWQKEKEEYKQQLEELKSENQRLKNSISELAQNVNSERDHLTTTISNFKEDYTEKITSFKNSFEKVQTSNKETFEKTQGDMLTTFNDFQDSSKEKVGLLLSYMENKQKEVEKLWGIIGKAAVSGSSQSYANRAKNFAHTMMVISLIIMIGVGIFLGVMFYKDISSSNYNPINLLYRIPLSFTLFIPAWYCASIANRQRNREFQLRDFEIKTAGLEPFMENMKMIKYNNGTNDDKTNKKDDTKLELVRDIFQNDLNRKKVDDGNIIIPKDILTTIKTCLDTWSKIKGKNG